MPEGNYSQNKLHFKDKYINCVLFPEQLRTGFSAPTTLITGIPNVLLLVKRAIFKRETGTGYTLNGATLNGLNYGVAQIQGRTIVIPTSLLNSGSNNLRVAYGPQSPDGTAASIIMDIVGNTGGIELGQPISWFNNGANYTGGSGRLGIYIEYCEIPFNESFYF